MLELEVNEGREIDSASWVGVVEILLCSCCESLEGIGVRREEDDSYLGVDWCFQALHSIIPTLASFEDVGGLLLIKFLSKMNKCEFWEYLSVSYDENCFGKSRKCCWCRIWLYWLYCTLYTDVVLLMKILRFLNLKWINFWPYLPHPLSLPILASCGDIGG